MCMCMVILCIILAGVINFLFLLVCSNVETDMRAICGLLPAGADADSLFRLMRTAVHLDLFQV